MVRLSRPFAHAPALLTEIICIASTLTQPVLHHELPKRAIIHALVASKSQKLACRLSIWRLFDSHVEGHPLHTAVVQGLGHLPVRVDQEEVARGLPHLCHGHRRPPWSTAQCLPPASRLSLAMGHCHVPHHRLCRPGDLAHPPNIVLSSVLEALRDAVF